MVCNKIRLKKGDNVKIIQGKYKGQIGILKSVFPETNRCIVEGVTKVKKHKKATSVEDVSGIVQIDTSIHISNVMYCDKDSKVASRLSYKNDKEKTRIPKKINVK